MAAGLRLRTVLLGAGAAVLLALAPGGAPAQPTAAMADTLAAELTTRFQVELIRERGLASYQDHQSIDAGEQRILAAYRAPGAGGAELDAAQATLARLAAANVARDPIAARESAAYRTLVTALTSAPDPALQAALAAFADGDRETALPAIEKAVVAGNAGPAQREQLAELVQEMAERGERTLQDAIDAWQAARSGAPSPLSSRRLANLYASAGRMSDAVAAARDYRAAATGKDEVLDAECLVAALTARSGELAPALAQDKQLLPALRAGAASQGARSVAGTLLLAALDDMVAIYDALGQHDAGHPYMSERWRVFIGGEAGARPFASDAQNAAYRAMISRLANDDQDGAYKAAQQLIKTIEASDDWIRADPLARVGIEYAALDYERSMSLDLIGQNPALLAPAKDASLRMLQVAPASRPRFRFSGPSDDIDDPVTLAVAKFEFHQSNIADAAALSEALAQSLEAGGAATSNDVLGAQVYAEALQAAAQARIAIGERDHDHAAFRKGADLASREVALQQRLIAAHEALPLAPQLLAEAYTLIGEARLQDGALADAASAFRNAALALQPALAAQPADSRVAGAIGRALYGVALATQSPDDWRAAAQFLAGLDAKGRLQPDQKPELAEARRRAAP